MPQPQKEGLGKQTVAQLCKPLPATPAALRADEEILAQRFLVATDSLRATDLAYSAIADMLAQHRRRFTLRLKPHVILNPKTQKMFAPVAIPAHLTGDVADLAGESAAYTAFQTRFFKDLTKQVEVRLIESGYPRPAAAAEAKKLVSKARQGAKWHLRTHLEEVLTAEELWAYGFTFEARLGESQKLGDYPPGLPSLSRGGEDLTVNGRLASIERFIAEKQDGRPVNEVNGPDMLGHIRALARLTRELAPPVTAGGKFAQCETIVAETIAVLENTLALWRSAQRKRPASKPAAAKDSSVE